MALPALLQRVVDWIREGYPEGLPERDYIALFALLGRRLSEPDLERIGEELARSGQLDSLDDPAQVRQAIARATNAPVDEAAVARVQAHLRATDWTVDSPPP